MRKLTIFFNEGTSSFLESYPIYSVRSRYLWKIMSVTKIYYLYMVNVSAFYSYQTMFQNFNNVCHECRNSSFQVWKIKTLQTNVIINISNTCAFFVRWWTIKVIFTSIALNSTITSFTRTLAVIETGCTFWTNRVTFAFSKIEKDLVLAIG